MSSSFNLFLWRLQNTIVRSAPAGVVVSIQPRHDPPMTTNKDACGKRWYRRFSLLSTTVAFSRSESACKYGCTRAALFSNLQQHILYISNIYTCQLAYVIEKYRYLYTAASCVSIYSGQSEYTLFIIQHFRIYIIQQFVAINVICVQSFLIIKIPTNIANIMKIYRY